MAYTKLNDNNTNTINDNIPLLKPVPVPVIEPIPKLPPSNKKQFFSAEKDGNKFIIEEVSGPPDYTSLGPLTSSGGSTKKKQKRKKAKTKKNKIKLHK